MCCDEGGSASAPVPQDNTFTDTLASIAQDRNQRAKTVFDPLEDQLVQSVQQYQSPDYSQEQVGKAKADVASGYAAARANADSDAASMGINPNDGAYASMQRGLTLGQAGQTAAAATTARERARDTAFNTLAGVSGRGDAKINEATNAANSGGNIYANLQRNDLSQEQSDNSGASGLGSLIGAGASALMMFSSPKAKTNVTSFKHGLTAIRKMPVKSFNYKAGVPPVVATPNGPAAAPPGRNVGVMADDYADATGDGDGTTVSPVKLLGHTVAAVQELDRKVSKMKGRK